MFKFKSPEDKEKTGFSQQYTKLSNMMLLFNLIRKNAPISRIMLAEMTGLSATTVSQLVEELLYNGLIREAGIADTNLRGRKPIMLEINGESAYFIVIELLSKGFTCSLYNLNVERADFVKYQKEEIKNGGMTLNRVIQDMIQKNGVSPDKLTGINILYPGIIDNVHKRIISSTVLDVSGYITPEDIARVKNEWSDAQFFITNSSVASVYSEYMQSSGISNSTIIEIGMDEGIGAGGILIGEKGECLHYYIIEVGHMVIERGGKPCKCGNRGCFEAVCGLASVIKRISDAAALNLEYDEEFGAEINRKAVESIRNEIAKGNEKVIAIADDVANMVETAIINIVNTVNAEYVFISGGIVDMLSESSINQIRRNVNELDVKKEYRECVIEVSKMDREMTRKGAAHMIIDAAFTVQE